MSSLLEEQLAVVAHSSLYVNLKLFVITAKHAIVPKISGDFSANLDKVAKNEVAGTLQSIAPVHRYVRSWSPFLLVSKVAVRSSEPFIEAVPAIHN